MAERSPNLPPLDIACCADLYRHPLIRTLLGDSWHPGGLALTRWLAKEIRLSKNDHLLDVACGTGTSALMVAQVYKCQVTGLDADSGALEVARKEARRYRLDTLVAFSGGDAARLPFSPSLFNAVLCECATSLFSDKRSAFGEMARVLAPGGRLALSDVTFRLQALPTPMDLPLAQALCIPVGLGAEGYVELIEEAGLVVESMTDYSVTVVQLLDKAESLLQVGELAGLVGQAVEGQLSQVAAAFKCARQLVQCGDLGYWAFIARKP